MNAKTSAQRQANLKSRRLAAGMVKFTHWVHADDVAALKAMIALRDGMRKRLNVRGKAAAEGSRALTEELGTAGEKRG